MNLFLGAFREAVLPALVAFACAACIAWRGDLPLVEPSDFTAPSQPRPLTFDVVYLVNRAEHSANAKELAEDLKGVFEETHLFSTVESTTMKGACHLELRFEEEFNEGALYFLSFLSGFTFFVFPTWGTADLSLEAVLYEGGVPVNTVRYEDQLHLVMQILLLPATPFLWPLGVSNEILRNLSLHAVKDLADR